MFAAEAPYTTAFTDHPADKRLLYGLPELLADVSLRDAAIRHPDWPAIGRLEAYDLTAITSAELSVFSVSEDPAGYDVCVEEGIKMTYEDSVGTKGFEEDYGGRPFLDTAQAIGLLYGPERWLTAVAAAGIYIDDEDSRSDTLRLVQIQDVTNIRKLTKEGHNNPAYYTTGMHNGMRWQDTLVRIWEIIAADLGVEMIIHADRYCPNPASADPKEYLGYYNPIASRMGYDPEGRYWVRKKKAVLCDEYTSTSSDNSGNTS